MIGTLTLRPRRPLGMLTVALPASANRRRTGDTLIKVDSNSKQILVITQRFTTIVSHIIAIHMKCISINSAEADREIGREEE